VDHRWSAQLDLRRDPRGLQHRRSHVSRCPLPACSGSLGFPTACRLSRGRKVLGGAYGLAISLPDTGCGRVAAAWSTIWTSPSPSSPTLMASSGHTWVMIHTPPCKIRHMHTGCVCLTGRGVCYHWEQEGGFGRLWRKDRLPNAGEPCCHSHTTPIQHRVASGGAYVNRSRLSREKYRAPAGGYTLLGTHAAPPRAGSACIGTDLNRNWPFGWGGAQPAHTSLSLPPSMISTQMACRPD
jgi:hypothetical protein